MKKEWIRPKTTVQQFEADEYVSACGDVVSATGQVFPGVTNISVEPLDAPVGTYVEPVYKPIPGKYQKIIRGTWDGYDQYGNKITDATAAGFIGNCSAVDSVYAQVHGVDSSYYCLSSQGSGTGFNMENYHYHIRNYSNKS